MAYVGSASRLRRTVRHLLAGRDVNVGVIGGSVSYGHGATKRGETDWFALLSKWLVAAFPRANVTARNGCIPGVPSSYMILCLEQSVDIDVDLLFIEFTLNNGHDMHNRLYGNPVVRDMERLVRRALGLPRGPAVVLLHVPAMGMAGYPPGHPKNPKDEWWKAFYETTEDAQGALAQYYDVQALSLRTAMYRLAVAKQQEGFLWEHVFQDQHPGEHGHAIMADLAVHLLQRTALGLLYRPYGGADEEAAGEALPGPMHPGNLPPGSPMCTMYGDTRPHVLSSAGWDYVVEGTPAKPKPGWVATQPGALLRLQLNTLRNSGGGGGRNGGGGGQEGSEARGGGGPVHVFFHHLRSYEHMGVARFSCASGCACAPVEVDAHTPADTGRTSQLYLARLEAGQAAECVVEVQVLERTSSGEHKFKIAGWVVAEAPGEGGVMDGMFAAGQHFGVLQHTGDREQTVYSSGRRRGGGGDKGLGG